MPENFLKRLLNASVCLMFAVVLPVFRTGDVYADIYSFVTVDGIETFTDAPTNKQARIVIKETSTQKGKGEKRKAIKQEKTRSISIHEIVEKTVRNAHQAEHVTPDKVVFEPKLPPVGGVITSGVGLRVDPIDKKTRHHNGIDIAIRQGTPVTPAAPGVVVYSGLRSGYGYTVLIEHPNGMVTLYAHNSELLVSPGQMVDLDTVIALSGNTGRSTGPHLHFEAWHGGKNITAAFMPGSRIQIPQTRVASYKTQSTFRREVLADGTILFTNLPRTAN